MKKRFLPPRLSHQHHPLHRHTISTTSMTITTATPPIFTPALPSTPTFTTAILTPITSTTISNDKNYPE